MYIDQKEIGQRIRILRKEKRLSQLELANRLDINMDHLSRIENGNKGMSLDLLTEFSKYLSVSTDYILFGNKQNAEEKKERISIIQFQLKGIER